MYSLLVTNREYGTTLVGKQQVEVGDPQYAALTYTVRRGQAMKRLQLDDCGVPNETAGTSKDTGRFNPFRIGAWTDSKCGNGRFVHGADLL